MSALDDATGRLSASRTVCVLSGAGVSTASGIPDFRGERGIWRLDPSAELRATIDAWTSDPEVRRRAWATRLATRHERPAPNAGHLALVDLERKGRLDTLVTQNVDGLHRAAGTSPQRLVEIHGNAQESVCLDCGDRRPIDEAVDRVALGEVEPACAVCGGMLKAAVISFGQSLVAADLERAEAAAARCDLLLCVGSTLSVWPAAGLVPIARHHGATVVIVNRGETAMDGAADVLVDGPLEVVLPAMVAGLSG